MVVRQSPRDSALGRAMNGEDHPWDLTNQLLAEAVDNLRVANWQRTRRLKRDFPKPIERPGVKSPSTTFGGKGALPLDEMAEWLGWNTKEATDGS